MPGQQQIEELADGTMVLHCNEHPIDPVELWVLSDGER